MQNGYNGVSNMEQHLPKLCDVCPAEALRRFVHYLHGTDLIFCNHHSEHYLIELFNKGFKEA